MRNEVSAPVAAGVIGGAIVGGALAARLGYYAYGPRYYGPGYGYYGGPAYVADGYYGQLLLAATALLGWLWLADSPRAGLRLISFIFVTKGPALPGKQPVFRDDLRDGLKKPLFQPSNPVTFTLD